MRILLSMRRAVIAAVLAIASTAAVVDRIAIIVGKSVITESEVLREVRLTQFLNHEPLDLSPGARRAAAERLVDQTLIRNEMSSGYYPVPADGEAAAMLRTFRQENYPDDAGYRSALHRYGITEDDLKQHLHWQLATMRFTDMRFPAGLPGTPTQSANRLGSAAAETDTDDVDGKLEAWLKEARRNTKIQFKPGAFQ